MANRRGKGEGSIYKRKDGLWVSQYKIQTVNGTKTKYIYSKIRKDAATKLAKAIADGGSGFVFDSGSLTVEGYLDRSLGKARWNGLSALQLQSLYNSKLDSGLSARTVRMIRTILHKALKQAVKWSLIPRNITEAVGPPREQRQEIRPLNEEEVSRLLTAVQGDKPSPRR